MNPEKEEEEDSLDLKTAWKHQRRTTLKRENKLITAAGNSTDNIRTNRTTTKNTKQKWEETQSENPKSENRYKYLDLTRELKKG